jgi:hypothetical protein
MVDDFIELFFKARQPEKDSNLRCLILYDPPAHSQYLKDSEFLSSTIPVVIHFPSTQSNEAINSSDYIRSYVYIDQLPGFSNPSSPSYNKPSSRIAYTRTLKLLRETLGPKFDLEKVFYDKLTEYRFGMNIVTMNSLLEM